MAILNAHSYDGEALDCHVLVLHSLTMYDAVNIGFSNQHMCAL